VSAADLEVFISLARTAVAERLPRAPESPAPLHHSNIVRTVTENSRTLNFASNSGLTLHVA
jgi:hypothetical protein